MVPNLNKWKFTKLHRKKRIINMSKGLKGTRCEIYNSGISLRQSQVITIAQLESIKKFINRKLKAKDKTNKRNIKIINTSARKKKKVSRIKEKTVIIRHNFNLGLTKKPLQVRMGKGKGAPVDWVYPCAKNRIFLEFVSKKVKLAKLIRVFKKAEIKLATKLKLILPKTEKRLKNKQWNKFNKLTKITCVKEL